MAQPYGAPPPYRQPPPSTLPPNRPRPSAAWFVVGGALVAVALLLFGLGVFRSVRAVTRFEATFPAQGLHQVDLPARSQQLAWVGARSVCVAQDGQGRPIAFHALGASANTFVLRHVSRFETHDGHLVFRCRTRPGGTPGTVRIGRLPTTRFVVGTVVLGVVLPVLLGGLGFVVVLVTAVLWVSRRPAVSGWAAPPS